MRYTLRQTGNCKHPVSEAELADLLVVSDYKDPTFAFILQSATSAAMAYTGRAFINQEFTVQWDGYPSIGTATGGLDSLRKIPMSWIELPYPPLVQIQSIKIIDRMGEVEEIDLDEITVDTIHEPGRFAFRKGWINIPDESRLQVNYKAGYGENADDVPFAIKHAILQIAGYMYEHRGQCDAGSALKDSGALAALSPFRIGRL